MLSSAGYETRVFAPTLNLSPSEKRTLTHSGVSVTRFGAHKRVDDTLVDWFDLIVEEHRRQQFNVLHAYFLNQAGFIATYAGKYLNIPSVVSIRGNDIEHAAFDPSRFSQVVYALQNAGAVTTNASELVKKAKAFFDREIILIPNGLDDEHFKPMVRNDVLAEVLGLNERKPLAPYAHLPRGSVPGSAGEKEERSLVIGFVGELRRKKGLKTLLSAYAQTNEKLRTSLLIVGEVRAGEDKKTFDEFVQANPTANIVVTGYISPTDLPAYYSLIDVFVQPSQHDGMPNALLEAMACEKPVIATPVGGMLDVVKEGENGLFVSVNDGDALANAIHEVLNNAELRSHLGKAARQTVTEGFSLQKELHGNLDVYRKLGLNL